MYLNNHGIFVVDNKISLIMLEKCNEYQEDVNKYEDRTYRCVKNFPCISKFVVGAIIQEV